ncbi:MAG: hypothetical protein HRS57_03215 [Mycoplasmataceae bacterium]|nr:hypothetical protein [Mycoplasmataceae bacterium]
MKSVHDYSIYVKHNKNNTNYWALDEGEIKGVPKIPFQSALHFVLEASTLMIDFCDYIASNNKFYADKFMDMEMRRGDVLDFKKNLADYVVFLKEKFNFN